MILHSAPSKAVLGILITGLSLGGVLGHKNGICTFEHNDIVSDACASYTAIEHINQNVRPLIRGITQGLDYFGYYRLQLFGKQCPFWSDEGMCGNIACAVTTIDDEDEIPPIWRAAELSKLEGKKAKQPEKVKKEEPSPLSGALGEDKVESCIVEADECGEADYCVNYDSNTGNGDYVSLLDNPERFTGYAGAGASAIWSAIYKENCFSKAPLVQDTSFRSPLGQFGPPPGQQKDDSKQKPLNLNVDDECLEKRVFYRVVSGMHASISMHLCFDHLNQTTGEWGPNLDCYVHRFQGHPERIQNIYFNYALVLRAVAKLRNYLESYTFCTADAHQNQITKSKVLELANEAASGPEIFDENVMFKGTDAIELKEDFKNRFRNVSRIMDCVGCDKCRLWGKIQTQGYGTALKVLFEFDENKGIDENPPLRRTELVALINTLDKLSTSIMAVGKFQQLWEARYLQEKEQQQEAEGVKAHNEQQHRDDIGILEAVWDEVEVVWEAVKFIVKSWFQLPGHLFDIVKQEITHLWKVYYHKQEGVTRQFQWWGKEPVDIRAIRDEKKQARFKDEL